MPELPEAETIARGLDARIAGLRAARVRVHRDEVVEPDRPASFAAALTGRRVERVSRRGKWIVAELDDETRWVTQLRMTGRFAWAPPGPLRAERHLSLSILFHGAGEGVLRFYDVRRFGRTWALTRSEWAARDSALGPEPLSERFGADELARILGRSRAPIRNVLLDQRKIAGLGNVYANEAAFFARIDPRRPADVLDRAEIRRLHRSIRSVLQRAIAGRGTSFSDYRDVVGLEGTFQDDLAVYGREGEPCRRCSGTVLRDVRAGRSVFLCDRCQR